MKRVLLTISLALLIFGLAAEDAMYGAFRVITKPRGADVTLYDADMYLSRTPTPVYPVWMDEYMDLVEGIPGRHIMLMITKKGYIPIRQEIFVPFTHEDEGDALECPSVFVFELEKDVKRAYHKVCIYYGYKYRKPRPRYMFTTIPGTHRLIMCGVRRRHLRPGHRGHPSLPWYTPVL